MIYLLWVLFTIFLFVVATYIIRSIISCLKWHYDRIYRRIIGPLRCMLKIHNFSKWSPTPDGIKKYRFCNRCSVRQQEVI